MSQSHLKKGTAAILAGVLSVSSVVPAFAAAPSDTENYDHVTTAGNKGNAAVTLTVEDREQPVIFSAYVPAELPIAIDANGDVTVPENAKIINGVENLPIAVEAIDVTMEDGWTLASMSDDLASEAKDTKKVAMEVLGQDLSDADTFSPAKIEAGSEIALNMQAKLPEQSASSKTKIATIGFTVNWWEDESTIPEVPELNATNLVSASRMRSVLHDLTGSIVFSTEMYDPEQHAGTATDISEAQDRSVMAVVNGQDAVVYSEGGTLAPENCTYFLGGSSGTGYKMSSLDLYGLDTRNVTNMCGMFFDDQNLQQINLGNLKTNNVANMNSMFVNLPLQNNNLDLTKFNTLNVTDMTGMFQSLKVQTIDLSTFDMSTVTNYGNMFYNTMVETVYCRTEEDAAIMRASSGDYSSAINFVVKQ